ncbi:MAG: phospholipase D family protein [Anaerolineae bacterium]|nr:phospholipase D family protein [Anaerolineae bacterium]
MVTDISLGNVVNGSTDVGALLHLKESIQNVEIVYLPRIHAKVYISGATSAIVSSANFTDGGFHQNLEYGVRLTEPAIVARVRQDIEDYAQLGGVVTRTRLLELKTRIEKVKAAVREEQKSINRRLRELSTELEREAEDELLRVRIHGTTINAILSQTILYLLVRRAMTTEELHRYIQEIHPDICDDTVDRVIDGEHFGKLWKHQVRNAQQHLKRNGLVAYDPARRVWRVVNAPPGGVA